MNFAKKHNVIPPKDANDRPALLELQNAGLQRDGRWLVRNINLTIRSGEIVTLIGPNGSGKSTTLKLALKIAAPSEGTVHQSPDLKISYIPQKLHIERTLPLTVEHLIKLTSAIPTQVIHDSLKMVNAEHLIHAQASLLSGGEFQRVMMARALARKPNLLVLDEPVQGVDFNGEAQLYEMIENFRDTTGGSVLLVSHDLNIVMAATDRVLCLNGHICCSGSPAEIISNPEYIRLFGHRASSALAAYHHHHNHKHLSDGTVIHEDGAICKTLTHENCGHCDTPLQN